MGAASIDEGAANVHGDVHCSGGPGPVQSRSMSAYRLAAAPLAFFLAASFFACVGDDPTLTPTPDASTADTGTDDGGPVDGGAPADGGVTDADANTGPTCVAPAVACGSTCADLKKDAANCGRCGHDCLGGTCTAGVCGVVPLTPGHLTTTRIRTDADSIYWLREGNTQVEAGIFKLAKTARPNTVPTEVVKELLDGTHYRSLALSDTAIYFHISGSSSRVKGLARRTKAGGSTTFVSTIMQLSDLAVTADDASVAYAVPSAYNQDPNGSVHVVDRASGTDTLVSSTSEANPSSLEFDSRNLYWLNAGTYKSDVPQKNGGLFRVGSNFQSLEKIALAPTETDLGNLAVAGATAFWTSNVLSGQQSLRTTSTNAGSSVGAFLGSTGRPGVVAANGGNVFWSEGGVLYTCAVSGCPNGATQVLASTGKDFTALEVDNDAIYFAKADGYVYKLAKP